MFSTRQSLHTLALNPSKIDSADTIENKREQKFEQLKSYLTTIKETCPERHFEIHEQILTRLTYEIGQEALADCLSQYDVSCDVITIDKQAYRKILSSKKRYQTSMGSIEIERHLYSNRSQGGNGKSLCPLELQSGIIEGYWTPSAAKNAMWALAHLTPSETENLLLQFGAMKPSRSCLDRLPKLLNEKFEPTIIEQHEKLMENERIPDEAVSVAVSLDGVMVAMKPLKKGEKAQSCQWKEASCGTISFFDAQGQRLSTLQYGRMPESKKITLKTLLQKNIEAILQQRPDLKLIHIADGAQDNWTFFDEQMPLGFQLTDFYHGAEHLKQAIDAAYKTRPDKAREQFQHYRHLLRHDDKGVDSVIRMLRYQRRKHKNNDIINATLTYFTNNKHRMKYALAKSHHYPIGSGIVEAACKTLVQQRLKRSGMSWCWQGGQAILTFRALIKSLRFDNAWGSIAEKYKKTIKTQDNVITFPAQLLC